MKKLLLLSYFLLAAVAGAQVKVTELPELTGSEAASADVLPIVDVSAGEAGSKKITLAGLFSTPVPWQGVVITGQYGGTGVANTGKTITLGGNLTTSGANALTLTTTGTTNVTLPTSGTLATAADVATKENSITAGTTGQYWRGDKTWQTLDKSAVGLGNVDNTSDASKPVSTAQQTALDAKADKSALTWIDVTKSPYNAAGDAQCRIDGAITSGTATLTSATASFVAGDVGKYIRVEGAGAAGADLITTIATRNSGTSVTLSVNASTTVSSKAIFWGTDDSAAINAAITAATSSTVTRTVYLPPLKFLGNVTLKKNVRLLGAWRGSVIERIFSVSELNDRQMTGTVMFPASTANPVIKGDAVGTVFGSGVEGIVISGSSAMHGIGIQMGYDWGVDGFASSALDITRCHVAGFDTAIKHSNAVQGRISFCSWNVCNTGVELWKHDGIVITGCDSNEITGNNFRIGSGKNVVIETGNYLNATIIDGVTYRDWIEDKFPAAGPSAGPRVISNIIELAGGQMQFQKQRVQTRDIPSDHDECREWLKKKFPQIKDIPDDKWAVRMTAKELVPEHPGEEKPHPINPRATRLTVTDVDDLPRELVAGSIEDWMRRKVGRVNIGFDLRISPAATAAERKLLEPLASMRGSSLVAANAITKIYKGITQWVEPEDAPVGIAAAIYNGLSVYQYEGSITTVMEDVSGERFHGCRLNVTGGRSEWAGMNAMVHSVSFDIATGSTTISVGPAPFLAAADMLELQRLLRGRKVTWMSENERTSNELGAESAPGSKGDTVGGFDGPGSEPEYHRGGRFIMTYEASTKRLYVSPGAGAIGPDPDDNIVRPKMATIDDDELTESPAPYLDCSGKTGTHELVCFMHADKVELMLKKQDDPEDEDDGDGEGFLIGTITFTGIDAKIERIWESDIPWPGEDSSSSGSSDSQPSEPSGGGGPPEESSEDGSDKSTAIVPAYWTKGGYTALFTVEAPDVRFTDILRTGLKRRVTRLKLDPRYVAVCEPDSISVVALTPEQPIRLGAKVEGGFVVITRSIWSGPCPTTVYVSGIRKGFAGVRFPERDKAEFEANERFLKSARPKRT